METSVSTSFTSIRKTRAAKIAQVLAVVFFILLIGALIAIGILTFHFMHQCSETNSLSFTSIKDHPTECSCPTTTDHGTGSSTTENFVISTLTTTENPKTEPVNLRLPKSILPDLYTLKLIPFLSEGNFTFQGSVQILVNVTQVTSKITLHAENLTIENITVWEVANRKVFLAVEKIALESEANFLIIYLNESLKVGIQYNVNIKFRGVLNDLMVGFYRSSYTVNNQTRWLAITQFEATDARKAFPCFDEPGMKAKFQVTLARWKNMTTLSNMEITRSENHDFDSDFIWDVYAESVPMSTYLVAFVISDLKNLTSGMFRVFAVKDSLEQAKYCLEIAPPLMSFFEEFFGIKYPLPKMDLVAVPDFAAGAMENWGLTTYRQSYVLYEEGTSTKLQKQHVATNVAHEFSHQWFGNLVTPFWWTDLWLNEGFACYMEYFGTDHIQPEWKNIDQFVVTELQRAFSLDALKTSHPISVVVNDPNEISRIFDEISYAKGAALIRMMQHFLTEEVFKKGLGQYLNERKYSNAEQDDLWMVMTKQSQTENVLPNSTVKDIMDTWTLQKHFPLVTVSKIKNSLVISQEVFSSNVNDTIKPQYWWIPITYTNPGGKLQTAWLPPQPEISLKLNEGVKDWVLVNVNQTGFYRVNYDPFNWELLIKQLRKPKGHLAIDAKNRAQMIDDAFHLAKAGYLDYSVPLNLSLYLEQEREYVPWVAARNNLEYLTTRLAKTEYFDLFRNYALKILIPFYDSLTSKKGKESDLDSFSRQILSPEVCKLGYRKCVSEALEHFHNWKNSPDPDRHNTIPPSLRETVYCTAIRVGDLEEWDFLWERYRNSNTVSDKIMMLYNLGCSREIWILNRYLNRALDESTGIRKQDIGTVFDSVAKNDVGTRVAWEFLQQNIDKLILYIGSSSMLLNDLVMTCTKSIDTPEELYELKRFIEKNKNKLGLSLSGAMQQVEVGEINVKWVQKNGNNIVQWLKQI